MWEDKRTDIKTDRKTAVWKGNKKKEEHSKEKKFKPNLVEIGRIKERQGKGEEEMEAEARSQQYSCPFLLFFLNFRH